MANMTFGVNIIPSANNTYALGNSDKKWNIYAETANMLVTGTGTAGQAGSSKVAYIPSLWTFNLGRTPTEGDTLTIKIPVAGVSSGVWMSVNNGTTYYPVATINKTRLTTQYPVDHTVTLIYQANMVTSIYGTSTSGAAAGASVADYTSDRWCVVNGYDSNTTYSAMTSANMIAGTETTVRGMRADYLKTGLQGILKVTNGDVQLYGAHLTGQVPAVTGSDNGKVLRVVSGAWAASAETKELPTVTSSDNGKVLKVVSGAWASGTETKELPTVSSTDNGKVLGVSGGAWATVAAPSGLPSVTSTDNGKFLRVVDGAWAAATVSSANGVSF